MKFVCEHKDKEKLYQEKIWTDETKIDLFGRESRNHVSRNDGNALKPKNTVLTVKFGGAHILVWGCFFLQKNTVNISVIDGRMDAAAYQNILEANLMISVENLEFSPDWTSQQYYDPKHLTKSSKKCRGENNLNILKWPSQI